MQSNLALNSQPSCFRLLSAGVFSALFFVGSHAFTPGNGA